jgi:hypothetical protein
VFCNEYDYNCIDCVDAWDLEKYYSCNESPKPLNNLRYVDIGDLLEFNQNGERIWGRVVEICSCDVVVEVITDLVKDHPFLKGDLVVLNIIHIYNHKKS